MPKLYIHPDDAQHEWVERLWREGCQIVRREHAVKGRMVLTTRETVTLIDLEKGVSYTGKNVFTAPRPNNL